MPDGAAARIQRLTKRAYRILGMEGYGRIDWRLDEHTIEAGRRGIAMAREALQQAAKRRAA